MVDRVDAQDADLLESPAAHPLGELAVPGLDLLATGLLDGGVEPGVAQHLGGPDDSESGRVARLEARYDGDLLAGGEEIIGVQNIALLLGVVAVGGARGTEDGVDEGVGAEDVADGRGNGQQLTGLGFGGEVGLDAGAGLGRESQHVVLVGGAHGVVVEVVDDQAGALEGQSNVELGKKTAERRRDGVGGAGRQQDVAIGVDELDQVVGRQVRSEACCG